MGEPHRDGTQVIAGLRFLGQSIKHATTVGAVWPSSKGLCRAMVEPVVTGQNGPLRVLEVGPGVGPVTAELVQRLIPGDTLDVVELNPEFCEILIERFGASFFVPTVHNVSILDFNPAYRYHHIVSGLPLANFPADMVEAIYRQLFSLLEPDGTLVMFTHIGGREVLRFFGGPDHRRRAQEITEIEDRLRPWVVGERNVVLNMPPARVVVRRKRGEQAS